MFSTRDSSVKYTHTRAGQKQKERKAIQTNTTKITTEALKFTYDETADFKAESTVEDKEGLYYIIIF